MPPRIALVHDWLVTLGGGERVLEALAELYPQADLFTTLHTPDAFTGTPLDRSVFTTVLQRLPGAARFHRLLVPLMPWAVERLDLRAYDVVISSSSAVAHGVCTQPGQLHVNYIHSPMRYAWDAETALSLWGWSGGLSGALARAALRRLRVWDAAAARRADHLIANSRYTAENVERCYGRTARVIYPPVRTSRFETAAARTGGYITVARLVPHKRIDLIVQAFNLLGLPLTVVGNGPWLARLRAVAAPNVSFMPAATDAAVTSLLGRARAFVYAAVEEFGIAVVEAQAAGCPVIAYGRAGVLETVVGDVTGILYEDQSVQGLVAAVSEFEADPGRFDAAAIRAHAHQFDEQVFKRDFALTLDRLISARLPD